MCFSGVWFAILLALALTSVVLGFTAYKDYLGLKAVDPVVRSLALGWFIAGSIFLVSLAITLPLGYCHSVPAMCVRALVFYSYPIVQFALWALLLCLGPPTDVASDGLAWSLGAMFTLGLMCSWILVLIINLVVCKCCRFGCCCVPAFACCEREGWFVWNASFGCPCSCADESLLMGDRCCPCCGREMVDESVPLGDQPPRDEPRQPPAPERLTGEGTSGDPRSGDLQGLGWAGSPPTMPRPVAIRVAERLLMVAEGVTDRDLFEYRGALQRAPELTLGEVQELAREAAAGLRDLAGGDAQKMSIAGMIDPGEAREAEPLFKKAIELWSADWPFRQLNEALGAAKELDELSPAGLCQMMRGSASGLAGFAILLYEALRWWSRRPQAKCASSEVFRGLQLPPGVVGKLREAWHTGRVILLPLFQSFSTRRERAEAFKRMAGNGLPVLFRLRQMNRPLIADAVRFDRHDEAEVLIHAGSVFKVMSVALRDDVYEVMLEEVIPRF